MLPEIRAIGQVGEIFNRNGRCEGHGKKVQEIGSRPGQLESDGELVNGLNSFNVVSADVFLDVFSCARRLRESIAVRLHTDDRWKVITRRAGRVHRIAEYFHSSQGVERVHLTRGTCVPVDAAADMDGV